MPVRSCMIADSRYVFILLYSNASPGVPLTGAFKKEAVNGSVTVNDMQKKNMDCDGSGEIDIDDVTTLMQFLVHAVDSLPVKFE